MKKIMILLIFLISFSRISLNSKELLSMDDKLRFLNMLNYYRNIEDKKPLRYSKESEKLSKKRCETINTHLKSVDSSVYVNNYIEHLHYGCYDDYLDFNTKLELYGNYTMPIFRENVIHTPNKNIKDVVIVFFEGWKKSSAHWKMMMGENINHISLHFEETDVGTIGTLILFYKNDKNKKRNPHSK